MKQEIAFSTSSALKEASIRRSSSDVIFPAAETIGASHVVLVEPTCKCHTSIYELWKTANKYYFLCAGLSDKLNCLVSFAPFLC